MESEYSIRYFTNAEVKNIPETVESIFNDTDNAHILRVQYENIVFITHFFCQEQIEFDLDPRDFVAIEQSKILIDFMHFIADTLNKEVIMTPENSEEHFIIKILPFRQRIILNE